jgi:hypothetical protein
MPVQIDKVDGWGIKVRVFTGSNYLQLGGYLQSVT